jgi:membrane protease YdiL (CAAX protease family)
VLAFLLLTFAITWATWLAPVPLGGPLFYVGLFAPALVAIGLTARSQGRAGVTQLLSGITRWDVDARWYLFAVSYMVVLKLTAAVIHRVVAGEWPPFGQGPWILMAVALLTSTWVQAGEEIGWRGYALPRLTQSLGLGGASVVLGLIWAVWHLPLFFIPGSGSHGQPFLVYLLYVVSLSVVLAWVYWKTKRSLFLVMLMHASVNNTMGIVPGALPYPVTILSLEASVVTWATIGLSSAVAVVLLFNGFNRFDRFNGFLK